MNGRSLCFAYILLSLCAVRAHGQEADPFGESDSDLFEISLDELTELTVGKVEGASKREQLTTDAPASVSIVSSQDIQRYGHRTLADILQTVRGFHVSYDRGYHFLGTRGVNQQDLNSHVLILVNGHRINNNLTDGGFIGTAFPLDVDLIERVEVVRGPGSVLYGNNAFFGVINVVTKRGADFGTAEVSGEAATFDTYKGRVTYGKRFENQVEMLLSGSYLDSDGEEGIYFSAFDRPESNNGIATKNDGVSFGSFFGNLSWRDFTLEGSFIDQEKRNPTAPYFTIFNDPRTAAMHERSYVNLKFQHEFPEAFDLTALLYYDRYHFGATLPILPPPFVLNRLVQRGEWWGSEIRIGKTFFERHRLTLGAEFRDDFRQHSESTFSPETSADWDRTSYGVYAEGDFRILEDVTLTAGARYDDYSESDSNISPRVALVYHPFETSTVKALYGTAFRTPNFEETPDLGILSNTVTDEITSYELAYEQGIGKHLRSTVNLFYNEIGNLLLVEFGGKAATLDARARGVEFGLDGIWETGWRGRVSYTLQDAENTHTGLHLTDSPHHLAKLNLSAPLIKEKLFAGVEVQLTGDRLTLQRTKVSDFTLVNFTLFSPNLLKGLDLSASVYNVFDRDYVDPADWLHFQLAAIPQPGRMFRMKLVYRF